MRRLVALLMLVAACAGARGAVYATVDRSSVQVNESFSLTLTADDGEAGEPDVSGLDADFDILGRSQSSSISIVNGERRSSRRWTYVLLPKAVGEFEVPPLSVDGASSEPIPVLVREAAVAPPGKADVFLEVSLDREQSWVQAQVVYTLKLYLGVATRQNSLDDPRIEGGEVIVERLADDRRYEAQIENRLYTVIERNFALFPQSSGEFTIEPVRFQASVWERGRISSPRVFTSEPLTLSVAPVVPPPPEFAGAEWLPASEVRLTASVRPDDGALEPGEPANVRLRLEADGLMSSQLPELEIPAQDGLRIYPDQPDLETRATQSTMRSAREQGFAVIASRGGVFELPVLEVPWFDTGAGEWRVASRELPALRAAGVAASTSQAQTPAPAPAASPAPPESGGQAVASGTPADTTLRQRLFRLRVVNYGLLALWLATLWLLWRGNRSQRRQRRKRRRERDAAAPFRATQKAMRAVQRACDADDARAASAALLAWAGRFWPGAPPRSLGDIAQRLTGDAAVEIEALNRHLYGAGDRGQWRGAALKRAMRSVHEPGAAARLTRDDGLPPLFPAG